MKKEYIFVIIAAVCLIAIAVFTVGGVLQDVDYHDLAGLPLAEQKQAYDSMQNRRALGEALQLVGAFTALIGFIAVAVTALTVGTANAEKAELKYSKE